MKQIFSHPILLYSFFIITTVFGWVVGLFDVEILDKVSVFNMIIFESIISLVIFTILLLLKKHSIQSVKKDFLSLSKKEILFFILFGLMGTLFGIWSTAMTKYNSVGTIEMIGFFISLIIGGIALHITKERKMNASRILGIIIIMFGGYLLMRK